jgi:hypothetical protein
MNPVLWAASQLISFPFLWWCVFVSVAATTAYLWRLRGILAGQIVVAVAVAGLDIQWVQTAMSAPGWSGSPDMDIFFSFGVTLRVVLINTVLLPVSFSALIFASRHRIAEVFSSHHPSNT